MFKKQEWSYLYTPTGSHSSIVYVCFFSFKESVLDSQEEMVEMEESYNSIRSLQEIP